MIGMSCYCIECGENIDHLNTRRGLFFGSWEYVTQDDEAVTCPHCGAIFSATLWGYDNKEEEE